MRRREKEIQSREEIEKLIGQVNLCQVSMSDDGVPYLVTMNYGYEDGKFYLHCAHEGRKIDILKKHPAVCVSIVVENEMVRGDTACRWGMKFKSVIASGTVSFLQSPEEKSRALSVLMKQCGAGAGHHFPDDELDAVSVIQITCDQMTGKQSGY
jgi:nitroimidazol reductase NimA-like FMN-containing flavoprotein (pyridoxamine 5'-phosphate oxidase superfamily)